MRTGSSLGRGVARCASRLFAPRAWGLALCAGAELAGCADVDADALAAEICDKHIECGIQLGADPETGRRICIDTYLEHFSSNELEACAECHEGKSCDELLADACHDECVDH
jgi:hypothetical protein